MIMDQVEARSIISKLKLLECPVLENSDDGWILEILFKPNFERYDIIEWIFSELEFRIPDSTNQHSSERKAENLLAAISSLGLCHKTDSNVIQGTAPSKDQLRLWSLLVDILWKKCSLSQKSKNTYTDSVSEEYNRSCEYIHKLCDNVNFKDLFDKKIQIFPHHILKEAKETCGILGSEVKTLKEIESLGETVLMNKSTDTSVNVSLVSKSLDTIDFNEFVFRDNETLIDLESNISSTLSDLQKHVSSEFNEAYLQLKPHISNISQDESVDVGPAFKCAQLQLESLTDLNKSLFLLKESKSELNVLNSNFENFHLSSEPLSDSLLGEYLTVLNNSRLKD